MAGMAVKLLALLSVDVVSVRSMLGSMSGGTCAFQR